MKIVIFSGTTEGRRLSEMLCAQKVSHFVCVATAYGSDVMKHSEYATVNIGRMDCCKMQEYLEELSFTAGDIIVDATHPYAFEVSKNIDMAAKNVSCAIIRIKRDADTLPHDGKCTAGQSYVNYHDSIEDFAKYIEGTEGNILLTTGSTNLAKYCENVSAKTRERTYVRVLPAMQSLQICKECAIDAKNILAMHGPFTYDLNRAVMQQYDIRHILTKDSGTSGGFYEKVSAAWDAGVSVHVLARPDMDDACGVSIAKAFKMITGSEPRPLRRIVIAGIGPGGTGVMTGEVLDAIRDADAVFGASSVLRNVSVQPAVKRYDMYRPSEITDVLSKEVDITNPVIIFSGDSGSYSGAKEAAKAIALSFPEAEITILPGISSVSYLASRCKTSYDDAKIMSIHGRNSLHNIYRLVHAVMHNLKTFALMSSSEDVARTARMMLDMKVFAKLVIGCDLSKESEQIMTLSCEEAVGFSRNGSITVLFINESYTPGKVMNVLKDDDLIRDKVPMTKECVRHESIARLGLCEYDTFYDIGGGTGSVALEAAALSPTLNVITVEKNPEAVKLIKKNIEKLGLFNVTVREGDALDVIPALPCPDCVFIGGSGGKLSGIISLIAQKGSGIRFVVNAVSLETVDEIRTVMSDMGIKDGRMTQLSVNDIELVGEHHMMRANNPVTIVSFTL